MNSQPRLAITTATLAVGLLLTSCGTAPETLASHGQPSHSITCHLTADRIDDYHRLGRPLPGCPRPRETAPTTGHDQCLVVADRVQERINLQLPHPPCLLQFQRAARRHYQGGGVPG
ncbi:MAG TPA: hypothetical protein VMT27_09020 [Actinomycetes bacterium]|nr:hypothetical protein [Actinomycetes bacterium]